MPDTDHQENQVTIPQPCLPTVCMRIQPKQKNREDMRNPVVSHSSKQTTHPVISPPKVNMKHVAPQRPFTPSPPVSNAKPRQKKLERSIPRTSNPHFRLLQPPLRTKRALIIYCNFIFDSQQDIPKFQNHSRLPAPAPQY